MCDKFLLKLSTIEKHRGDRNDDHLLIDLVKLRQRLKNPWDDVIALNLLLGLFMNAQISYGRDDVTKDLLLTLMVQQLKEYFKKALLEQMIEHQWILGQVADEFDHKASQFIIMALVNRILETVEEG